MYIGVYRLERALKPALILIYRYSPVETPL